MAIIATPLIIGHIVMATLNPDTRTGLSGMISGYVDRKWAKHHYGRWYREHHEIVPESSEEPASPDRPDRNDPDSAVHAEKKPDK
jgi:cytochrome b subunit of formate dehydrogenase